MEETPETADIRARKLRRLDSRTDMPQSVRLRKADREILAELSESMGMGKAEVIRRALFLLYGAMKASSRERFILPALETEVDPYEAPAGGWAALRPELNDHAAEHAAPLYVIDDNDLRWQACRTCDTMFAQEIRPGRPYVECEDCRAIRDAKRGAVTSPTSSPDTKSQEPSPDLAQTPHLSELGST